MSYLGIESHFVGVHGPYELHRKEKQIKCTEMRCMKICFSYRCNSYGPWTPTKCDSILIFTSFNNKVCCDIAYFNTKMSHISNEQKVRHLEQPSRRKTNWRSPPCDPVQIIRSKDWHFKSLIIVNTATSYFFTNLHAIYVWNGHRERRFSHWYLQLHTRLAERYRS